jgi:predicted outer membrane repeat protein
MAHLGSPVVRDCVFVSNVASHGGAIALAGCDNALVERCTFTANANSDSTAAYLGAAVYVTGGSATLRELELRGGGAGRGGAVAVTGGAVVTAADLVVADNRAIVGGAGLYVADAELDLSNSEVVGNTGLGVGGGLYADGGVLRLRNVRIDGNTAAGVGGGIYAQGLTGGVVQHSLVRGNSAINGGGAILLATGLFVVSDNVLVDNTGGGLMASGASLTADHNLAHNNAGGDFLSAMGPHDLVADPRFLAAAAGDFAPALHSPLVDSGSGLAGADWDGGTADRGLHGGSLGTPASPARVTGLAGAVAGSTVSLAWDAVEGAAAYTVYRDSTAVFSPDAASVCATVADGSLGCVDTPPPGDWYYLVAATDADGRMGGYSERWATSGGATPVTDGDLPTALAVTGVAPNPFNPRTVVRFAVPEAAAVRLRIFDLRGRAVATLVDGQVAAGNHTVVWDGVDHADRPVAAGVYLLRLDDGRTTSTRKAVLAR